MTLSSPHHHHHHRLNGSSSPVLTATPHSYGKGQNSTLRKIKIPERIQIKFGTRDYVHEVYPKPNLVMIGCNPWPPGPQNRQNLLNFGRDNFRSISRLTLGVSGVNTPYSSSEPIKSEQAMWGWEIKIYTQILHRVAITWYRACAMAICTGQALCSRISRKRLEIRTWSQWTTYRKRPTASRIVTWPMMSRFLVSVK